MTVDTKNLRAAAEDYGARVGMHVKDLAQWRIVCPPGAVIELIDAVEAGAGLVVSLQDELELMKRSIVGLTEQQAAVAAYVDDAKRAAGPERVAGEPLAEFIARMRAELAEVRAERDVLKQEARELEQQRDHLRAGIERVLGKGYFYVDSVYMDLDELLDDESRCAVCAWPLAASVDKGCTRGNCSHRPRPVKLYAPARAEKEANELAQRERMEAGHA